MRSFARRWSALVATATLAVRLLAPDLGHQCAADLAGPLELAAGKSAAVSPAHAEHAHDPAPAADVHAGHGVDFDATTDGPAHDCDCETTCCCVATAAAHVAFTAPVFASFTLARTLAISSATQWEPAWVDHVLPFNTPPPLATLG